MEIGRVINDRYLLQRIVRQGQVCTIYQGIDQRLQRGVAVKVVPIAYAHVYKASVRLTSQFSHPNIIGLYDMISEPESLYLVQEFIEGDNFATLLNMPLTPYDVADIGSQFCQALLYASFANSTRRVSHGDLTPAAILRERNGLVHVNNFALPSDISYFTVWNVLGGEGSIVSDRELPWGVYSDGRQADDTRSVGLLLYQLLTSRPTGSLAVEPPADGRLRFMRNTPPELCELVARAVVRQHPQHINTLDVLYTELKTLSEALEPAQPLEINMVYQQAPVQPGQPRPFQPMPSTGKLVTSLSMKENSPVGVTSGRGGSGYLENIPPLPATEPSPAGPVVPNISTRLVAARQAAYHETGNQAHRRPSLTVLILLCLVVFALFFIVGYFGGHLLFPQ